MGDFKRDNRGRGGQRYGRSPGRKSFGGRDPARIMHRATCAECGSDCEIPFRPTGDKPVYCRACFEKRNGADSSSRYAGRTSFRKPGFGGRRIVPHMGSMNQAQSGSNEQVLNQLKSLNHKLDQIIGMMSPVATGMPTAKIKTEKKTSRPFSLVP